MRTDGAAAVAKKGAKQSPGDWAKKPLALQLRGAPEWKAWVERLAKFDRASASEVTDRALAAYARSVGFPELPPER